MNSYLDIASLSIAVYFFILLVLASSYALFPKIGIVLSTLIFCLFAGSGFDRNGILNYFYCKKIDGYEILSLIISNLSCLLPERWGFYFFLSSISFIMLYFLIVKNTSSFINKFLFSAHILSLTIFSIGPARQDVCVMILIATTLISVNHNKFKSICQLFTISSHKSLLILAPILFKINLSRLIILLLTSVFLLKFINFSENYLMILLYSYIQEREEIDLGQSSALYSAILFLIYSCSIKYSFYRNKIPDIKNDLLLVNVALITSIISIIGIVTSDFINLSILTRYIRIPTVIIPYLLLIRNINYSRYIGIPVYTIVLFKVFNSYNAIPEDFFGSQSIYFLFN